MTDPIVDFYEDPESGLIVAGSGLPSGLSSSLLGYSSLDFPSARLVAQLDYSSDFYSATRPVGRPTLERRRYEMHDDQVIASFRERVRDYLSRAVVVDAVLAVLEV